MSFQTQLRVPRWGQQEHDQRCLAGGGGRRRGSGLHASPHWHPRPGQCEAALPPGGGAPRQPRPRHPQDGLLLMPEQDSEWHTLLRGREWQWQAQDTKTGTAGCEEKLLLGFRFRLSRWEFRLRVRHVGGGAGVHPGQPQEPGGEAAHSAGQQLQAVQVQSVPVLPHHHHLGLRLLYPQVTCVQCCS